MRSKQLILTILSLYCGIASAGELLRLGYIEYFPVVYSEKANVPKGPLIDYIEKNLGAEFEIKWVDMPLGRVRWAFENDVIDAFPFLLRLEEREAWIHYFEKPYLTMQNIICSRQGLKFAAENPDSLPDLMAGSTLVFPLNAGYKYPFLSDPRIKQINIHYTNYIDRSLELLYKGRANYVFYSSKAGLELGGKNKNLSCVDVGKRVGLYFAFSKNNRLTPRVESILGRLEILQW